MTTYGPWTAAPDPQAVFMGETIFGDDDGTATRSGWEVGYTGDGRTYPNCFIDAWATVPSTVRTMNGGIEIGGHKGPDGPTDAFSYLAYGWTTVHGPGAAPTPPAEPQTVPSDPDAVDIEWRLTDPVGQRLRVFGTGGLEAFGSGHWLDGLGYWPPPGESMHLKVTNADVSPTEPYDPGPMSIVSLRSSYPDITTLDINTDDTWPKYWDVDLPSDLVSLDPTGSLAVTMLDHASASGIPPAAPPIPPGQWDRVLTFDVRWLLLVGVEYRYVYEGGTTSPTPPRLRHLNIAPDRRGENWRGTSLRRIGSYQ